ncbi:MAG: ComEA family DNA-binding protein [Coriobacteriia bacterium]|nr:ComEA family DNA-binding protein [Coriobacteriia bacterium]
MLRRAGVSSVTQAQVVVVVVLALACAGWFAWRSRPPGGDEFTASEAPGTTEAPEGAGDAPGGSEQAGEPAELVVHVVGAVAHPGVYRLPAGSRVADAVEAAGGALGNAAPDAVNFARLLSDGEQLALPTREEWGSGKAQSVPGGGSGAAGAPAAAAGVVDLNTADEAALDTLPGVGPATARRIVEDRAANGPFARPEDLMRVSGIGEKKYEALKDLVTVR